MALLQCLECQKEIGSTVKICHHCGTDQIKFKKLNNNGFWNSCSWLGFFFGPIYYAGYGKLKKAIIMLFLSYIPFVVFFVAVHCGNNAKKELPIGKEPFNWSKALFIIFLAVVLSIPIAILSIKTEQNNSSNKDVEITDKVKSVINDIVNTDSEEVKMVKNGKLTNFPTKTIGEAVQGFFVSSSWSSGVAQDGTKFVNIEGQITYMEKPINAKMQFELDKNSTQFSVRALEFNELPQNNLMVIGLLGKMYEENSIKGEVNQSNKENTESNNSNNNNVVPQESNIVQNNTVTQPEVQNNQSLIENKVFAGVINNNIKFHITLTRNGNILSGKEYYDAYKKDIQVSGEIDNQNNFLIYELDTNGSGQKIGMFKGQLIDGDTIIGSWSKPDGSKIMSFSATDKNVDSE